MTRKRESGILLHPTSLPGPHGLGSLGEEAFRFVDFLAETGQSVWQILPLGPTGYGDSPYSAFSAFAGNAMLISLEKVTETGDLPPSALEGVSRPEGEADYGFVYDFKGRMLFRAAHRFNQSAGPERRQAFDEFCAHQAYWLNDYVLFRALRRHFGERSWLEWPEDIRRREPAALAHWGEELSEQVFFRKYAQFVFFEQWFALKRYANQRGIRIMGDLPIFIALDSVDVWANARLFYLDEENRPILVAGVPPDYFSETGQRWGNPMYRWERMAEQGFSWWMARFRWNLAQTDMVRIDHFRGFESCWAIPAEEETAVNGQWMPVPGEALFQTLLETLGEAPVVAEDLGLITPQVEALRDRFGFPGMKVLQFAFGSGPDNPYLPHNLVRNCVVYTGTHDNDTTLGWWRSLKAQERREVLAYLGSTGENMPWDLIRPAMASVADLCILPLQDILGLNGGARMNTPGAGDSNWRWRFLPGALGSRVRSRLAEMTRIFGRKPA